jgi:phage-related minor tail protein
VTIETSAAENGIKRLRDEVAMWGLAIRGAVDGFRMVGQALNVVLQPALEAEQGLNRVKEVVESTGQAAGFAAEEIAKQAADIQEAFAFDDDMIMNDLMTPLLTFTNVTGEAFKEAQVAIMDMNRALGVDGGGLKNVALQVGKALQDPITGLTALRRSGVSFTEDQQKMIKSLVEAGDAAGAQKIILQELNKEFGGRRQLTRTAMAASWSG